MASIAEKIVRTMIGWAVQYEGFRAADAAIQEEKGYREFD
jgi:hypothetical protein